MHLYTPSFERTQIEWGRVKGGESENNKGTNMCLILSYHIASHHYSFRFVSFCLVSYFILVPFFLDFIQHITRFKYTKYSCLERIADVI